MYTELYYINIFNNIIRLKVLAQFTALVLSDVKPEKLGTTEQLSKVSKSASSNKLVIISLSLLVCSHHNKFFRSASKPKEKSRSASSTTSISRVECRTRFWALRWASTRDGVPTTTSGFSIKIGLFRHNTKHQPQTESLDLLPLSIKEQVKPPNRLTSVLIGRLFRRCRPLGRPSNSTLLTFSSCSGPADPALWSVPGPELSHPAHERSEDNTTKHKDSNQDDEKRERTAGWSKNMCCLDCLEE